MAGRYRGVPNRPGSKRDRLERVASEMRRRNQQTRIGRIVARAIEQRTGKAAV